MDFFLVDVLLFDVLFSLEIFSPTSFACSFLFFPASAFSKSLSLEDAAARVVPVVSSIT